MRVNFLTSTKVLAKSFSPNKKLPYPQVSNFTSHPFDITGIDHFYNLIKKFAFMGGCLLKGELLHPLIDQSRAGSTASDTPTWYDCFDIDRCHPDIATPEAFILQCLPPCYHNTSYIWQVSNSAKISKHCLAGHLFFLRDEGISAKLLKQIYTAINFNATALSGEITLSHNGQTLSYGLDPTTAQNDKLLFISPPILTDIEDPFEERITLHIKSNEFVKLNSQQFDFASINGHIHSKLNELRNAAGLPKKSARLKTEGGVSVLTNPERAIFRGPYITERGFVYGNLNNGDSYAYYHVEQNPKYLYNFKGEPNVRIKDIDPDYWNSLAANNASPDLIYTAFRDRLRDCYYTLIENRNDHTYAMHRVGNLQKAMDFLKFYHQELPETLPIWDVVFQPNKPFTIDYDNMLVNTYQPTDYLKSAEPSNFAPTKFFELITHVTGDDAEMRDELLNWLAFIFQKKEKTQTAFILQGRTGTGKGVLFNKIIRPILGPQHCPMIMMDDIDSNFNEWTETALLVIVDEAQINDDPKRSKKRMNKIKNIITEPINQLRIKNVSSTQHENFLNMLFTSNEYDSIHLAENDRRFKVAPRQEKFLEYSDADLDVIHGELQDIANYMMGYPVDEVKVRQVKHNDARSALIQASQSSLDEFIAIIKEGDIDKLLSYSNEFALSVHETYKNRYEDLINTWQHSIGTSCYVPTADLRVAYNYLFNTDIGFVRFGKVLATKSVVIIDKKINKNTCRCVPITWQSKILTSPFAEKFVPCGHTVN